MSYVKHNITLSDGQLSSLRAAINAERGLTIRIAAKPAAGGKTLPLLLTPTQVTHLRKNFRAGNGVELKFSKTQVKAMKTSGGILPLLAPLVAAAPTIAAALGTGALSGAAGFGTQKALKKLTGKGFYLSPKKK